MKTILWCYRHQTFWWRHSKENNSLITHARWRCKVIWTKYFWRVRFGTINCGEQWRILESSGGFGSAVQGSDMVYSDLITRIKQGRYRMKPSRRTSFVAQFPTGRLAPWIDLVYDVILLQNSEYRLRNLPKHLLFISICESQIRIKHFLKTHRFIATTLTRFGCLL